MPTSTNSACSPNFDAKAFYATSRENPTSARPNDGSANGRLASRVLDTTNKLEFLRKVFGRKKKILVWVGIEPGSLGCKASALHLRQAFSRFWLCFVLVSKGARAWRARGCRSVCLVFVGAVGVARAESRDECFDVGCADSFRVD